MFETGRRSNTKRDTEKENGRDRDDDLFRSAATRVYRSIVAVNYILQMFYSVAISVSNLHAMYQPIASIPTNGTVPTKPAGKTKEKQIKIDCNATNSAKHKQTFFHKHKTHYDTML